MPRSAKGVFREALIVHMLLQRSQATQTELVRDLALSPTSVRSELALLRRKGVVMSVPRGSTPKLGLPRPVQLVKPDKMREWYDSLPPNLQFEVSMHCMEVAEERLQKSQWELTQALARTKLSAEEVAKRLKSIRTPREAEKKIEKAKREVREREEASEA